jgi:tetratricopeptide (TPR) repeat protein
VYKFLFLALSQLFFTEISLANFFDFSDNCLKAYHNIIALKIDSGKYYLKQDLKQNPDNKIPALLYNYIDFLEIYTNNSADLYTTKRKDFDARLKEIKSVKSNSPYYLFAQGEIHLQAAVLHIKFGEYFSAVMQVRKALSKLDENRRKYPDFKPNYKSLGLLNTILGSIPQQYKAGMSFLGLSGNVNEGMQMIEKLVNDKTFIFQHEAATIYAFLQLHISNDAEKAWQTLKKNNFFNSHNLMDAYSIGHIGIHGFHNDEGIKALINRPKGKAYISFQYLDFLLGLGKTYKQDNDANIYFSKFLENNKGEDYIKSAWHKMAWNELIKGNNEQYEAYIQKVLTQGRATLDTDKQAEKEAKLGEMPNSFLLKVRLLSDGNYLEEAITQLKLLNINDFENLNHKTEFFYRNARVYDKINDFENAKKYYELTINNGLNISYYYAANSAYLLGNMLEKLKQYSEAKKYYELSLSLNGFEYDNSIKQKSKAGLNRIKG